MKRLYYGIALVVIGLAFSHSLFAYVARIVPAGEASVSITSLEQSQYFFDTLAGSPRPYLFELSQPAELKAFLMVPAASNQNGRYSFRLFLVGATEERQILAADAAAAEWQETYDALMREYFLKGPEVNQQLEPGKYRLEVYSAENVGKYVLALGDKDAYTLNSLLPFYWQIPQLKMRFFETSILEFFLTPFSLAIAVLVGVLLILIALINYLVAYIKERIQQNHAKTILLTSNGMDMKDEIIKLLQKPTYDVTVAFIDTASKPIENRTYVHRDLVAMQDLGFNVEVMDIDEKTEGQVMDLLKFKDIIFVEGGNTHYLLNSMRRCNFEKVIKKLLKEGKVYIGVSAGSIVAGKTIQPANWFGTGDHPDPIGLKSLRGLNLVPFDIRPHYIPEKAEIILKKIPNPRQRAKRLKILSDGQALLVQGKEVFFLGQGEEISV